jgi:branched-chain amino acid transport system permease protein
VNAYQEGLLIGIGVNIILALGLWVTVSTGQFSLGHAGFMAIGAYLASMFTLKMGWDLVPAMLVAAVVAGAVGAVFGFPALRLNEMYLIMATLGFAGLVQIFFINFDYLGGVAGLHGMHGTTLPLTLIVTALVMLYAWRLTRSRLGLAHEAIRLDIQAARACGLNVTSIKVLAFGVGGFITGLGGALAAHQRLFISPDTFDIQQSVVILLFVILGGSETWLGPVLGAIILTLFPEVFRFLNDWYLFVYGALLVVLVIFRPQGILGRRGIVPLSSRLFRMGTSSRRRRSAPGPS